MAMSVTMFIRRTDAEEYVRVRGKRSKKKVNVGTYVEARRGGRTSGPGTSDVKGRSRERETEDNPRWSPFTAVL